MHSNFEFSSSEEEWNTGTLNAEERVNTIQKKEMLEHLMQKKEKLSSFIAQNNFGENCLHSQHRRRWERCKYEFWPTKEKLRTTNLIDSKDCHFSTFVWWGKPCILFWFRCYRCINFNQIYSSILDEQILPCATIVKKNIMKEWRKIDVIARGRVGTAIWNCPKVQNQSCFFLKTHWRRIRIDWNDPARIVWMISFVKIIHVEFVLTLKIEE